MVLRSPAALVLRSNDDNDPVSAAFKLQLHTYIHWIPIHSTLTQS